MAIKNIFYHSIISRWLLLLQKSLKTFRWQFTTKLPNAWTKKDYNGSWRLKNTSLACWPVFLKKRNPFFKSGTIINYKKSKFLFWIFFTYFNKETVILDFHVINLVCLVILTGLVLLTGFKIVGFSADESWRIRKMQTNWIMAFSERLRKL